MRAEYVAPRTPVEQTLVGVWQELLGIGPIGVLDNFFELGGDSVVSIQIISRANASGLGLTPKQVFDHQTIAELAAIAGVGAASKAEDDEQEGPFPLTPIQRWFFEQDVPFRNHFNQTMLLSVDGRLEVRALRTAVAALESRHGALRLRCRNEGGQGWTSSIAAAGVEPVLTVVDISGLSGEARLAEIARVGADVQASLNLSAGPVYRLVYFDAGAAAAGRLLFTAHHLAIDVVSWRILAEQLTTGYEQASHGAAVVLPPATTSLRKWAHGLETYARDPVVQAETPYWLGIAEHVPAPLPIDHEIGPNTLDSTAQVVSSFEADETQSLLQAVPRVYDAQINDVLLTALALAVCGATGGPSLLVDVEGHGRESIIEGVDLSRTVGWFTTMYPLRLEIDREAAPERMLQGVKEQLRTVPRHGIGFGLLRYLTDNNTSAVAPLGRLPRADVLFLYLGQFDQRPPAPARFGRATDAVGPERYRGAVRPHLLEVTAAVRDGRLQVSWTYSANRHRRESIAALARAFDQAVRTIVARSGSGAARPSTPADFPHAGLDQAALDTLMSRLARS